MSISDDIKVERYDGDRALQSGLRRMAKKGWTAQTVNSRKAALGVVTGPFTTSRSTRSCSRASRPSP